MGIIRNCAWLVAGLVLAWGASLAAADRLVILQTSDVHAHTGQWPRLATMIRAEREAAGAGNVLLIDCGDTGQGTLAGALARGADDLAALNRLAYDAWIPGNHEFDYGADRFRELVGACRAAVLAANLAGERLPANLRAWRWFEKAGRRIAVIGMTSPYLDHWFMPPDLDGLRPLPVKVALDRIIPEIMAAKPDLVVLAVHHGRYTPARLGGDSLYFAIRDYPQIMLVLGGHSHEAVPGARLGWHGWFVQPGQHGEYLARIEVSWPPEAGAAPLISSRLLPTAGVAEDAAMIESLRSSPAVLGARNPFAVLPDGFSSTAYLQHAGQAASRAAGADGALVQLLPSEAVPPGPLDDQGLFRIIPYENQLWRVEVTPAELAEIVAEQNRQDTNQHLLVSADGRIGAIPAAANGARLGLAVSNYALAGGGGRFPRLRQLGAEPGRARPAGTTVRDALRACLRAQFSADQTGAEAAVSPRPSAPWAP